MGLADYDKSPQASTFLDFFLIYQDSVFFQICLNFLNMMLFAPSPLWKKWPGSSPEEQHSLTYTAVVLSAGSLGQAEAFAVDGVMLITSPFI